MLTKTRLILTESIKRIILYALASLGVYVLITFITYLLMPLIDNVIRLVNNVYAPVVMCISFYAFLVYFLNKDRLHIEYESMNELGFNYNKCKELSVYYCILSFFSFIIFEVIVMYFIFLKGYSFLFYFLVPSYIPMLMQNNVIIGFILSLVIFAAVLVYVFIRPLSNHK